MLGVTILITRAGWQKPSYATAYACNSSSKCHIIRKIRPELLRKSFFLPKTEDEQSYVTEIAEDLQVLQVLFLFSLKKKVDYIPKCLCR